jgi:nickel transport protein
MVFTESSFGNGRKCQNSRIEVFDSFDNTLLEGQTDENGEFSFKPPQVTDLKIVLTASMGHTDEYVIPAGELADGVKRKIRKLEPHGTGSEPLHIQGGEKDGVPVGHMSHLELEQIRTVVEEALDEKMKPILKLLIKQRSQRVSFVQVMGGIGCIFGIMGIIMYVRSRRGR